tara:strand:+ start:52 stop:756 length:705 start_codon:yes stop_codon:yes gene_type:complete
MNKLLTTIVAASVAIMSFAGAANSIEFKLGVGGTSSAYYANAEEKLKGNGHKSQTEAVAAFSYMTGFAEVAFDEAYGITLGVEYSPESIKLDKATRTIQTDANSTGRQDDASEETGDQVIEASFKDLMNIYVAIPIMGSGLNLKAGYMSAKLTTKEVLATGSTYGNKTVNGGTFGMFYDGDIGSNAFYRIEGAYNSFDDITMRGSEADAAIGDFNVISAELTGVAAKVSVGMKF